MKIRDRRDGIQVFGVLLTVDIILYTSTRNTQEKRRLPTPRFTSHVSSPLIQLKWEDFIKASLSFKEK